MFTIWVDATAVVSIRRFDEARREAQSLRAFYPKSVVFVMPPN